MGKYFKFKISKFYSLELLRGYTENIDVYCSCMPFKYIFKKIYVDCSVCPWKSIPKASHDNYYVVLNKLFLNIWCKANWKNIFKNLPLMLCRFLKGILKISSKNVKKTNLAFFLQMCWNNVPKIFYNSTFNTPKVLEEIYLNNSRYFPNDS